MVSRWAVFALSALFASVFFIDFCNLVFRCGCRSLWAGADAHCNIHRKDSRHCPWCESNPAPAYVSIVGAQAFVSFRRVRAGLETGRRLGLRLIWAVSAFPLVGGAWALWYGWRSGYWN